MSQPIIESMPNVDPETPAPANPPQPLSRRSFLQRVVKWSVLPAACGVYGTEIEPFWLDVHPVAMPVPNLPASFKGYRIAQLSDLHVGPKVPYEYLQRMVAQLNRLKPDLVVITGDLMNWETPLPMQKWITPACELVKSIAAPTIFTFGNHEYGCCGTRWIMDLGLSDQLEDRLTKVGCKVLRNQATAVEHPDGRIWIVGLDEAYAGRFNPEAAFVQVNKTEPVIALSHNPDTAVILDSYKPDWILAGHTHGGQVRMPGLGALMLPIINRRFDAGQFQLTNSRLYVTRGIGFVRQIRFACRPELPVFELTSG